ncbi:MAG TPA: hypothetical protein VL463_35370 [Kofleriaceae bacterium]|nr:hypothetical protein [Kofleriaceae bacterium]
MLISSLLAFAPIAAHAGGGSASASASVSVSIKADVDAKGAAEAAAGDAAYAKGDFQAALTAYGQGFAKTRDATFLYAEARCQEALGHKDDAKAMFNMYLSASGKVTLKYKGEAEAAIGAKAKEAAGGAFGAVGAVAGKVKDAAVKVADVGAGVYSATKVSIAASIDASAKAEAKAADTAYAAGKYEDAAASYAAAYAKSQQSVALYAEAQAKAQAQDAISARALLAGYLSAQPKGTYAKDAKTLMMALGGSADWAAKVSVSAKVSADVKAQAQIGDKAMVAGKFIDAAKAYGDAYAKKADAALLYAKGMAQFYAGMTADAATSLKAYLAAGGNLEFKAQASATLRASGSAA